MIPRSLIFTFSVVLLVATIECKKLPSYIKKCSIQDPDEFTKCAVESAKIAFPRFINGDPENKVPNLNPLYIPFLHLSDGSSLNVTLTNSIVEGIRAVEFNSISYDKASKKLTLDMRCQNLKLITNYTVEGKILVLPIVGAGKGFIDFRKPHLVFTSTLNIVKNKKEKEVVKVENLHLDIEFGGAEFNLENLFNGDKALGEHMNKFLNDNWSEVITEFQALVKEPMLEVIGAVESAFLNNLLYPDVFDGI